MNRASSHTIRIRISTLRAPDCTPRHNRWNQYTQKLANLWDTGYYM